MELKSRAEILSKLRRQVVDQADLPDSHNGPWIQYDDPIAQFAAAVELVGGSCKSLASVDHLESELAQYESWKQAQRIFSGLPTLAGNVNLEDTAQAHDLQDLDFVIYRGDFAVAENGAIWLTDHNLKHRVVFFITQFLVLVVDRNSIVNNMHEAYARIDASQPGFGLFLSGPSKTADIEQSLVIGAHGCRELQVFLV